MKRIIPHIPNITASASVLFASVVVFASAFLLSGCSESELLSGNDNVETNRPALTIEVSDGGYAPAAGEKSATREKPATCDNPATRATENDYTTQFTADDKIGVFAVKDGAIVDGVNNLCLVATTTTAPDGSTSLVWQTEDGNTPKIQAGAAYYAYYPYQSTLNGDLVPGTPAPEAAAFFANVISNWSPSTDQGTYTAYTSFDLMIAKGTTSGKTLSFSMLHQMALVVIDLPKTKYTLTDAASRPLPEYILDAPDTKFNTFTPCWMGDGTYRYLINPAASQSTTLSGSYTNATPATAEWEFTANVPASQYKKYVVDNGSATVIVKPHQLQAGDFFMKDGTLLSKETNPLSNVQKAACIGIVYWVGSDAFDEDPLLKRDYPGCKHGLVVALQDAGDGMWSNEYEMITTEWINKDSNPYNGTVNLQETNKRCGYSNTVALTDYNAGMYNSVVVSSDRKRVLPIDAIQQYAKNHPAPANSSGWYFPSVMELKYVCWGQGNDEGISGRDNLNTYINKVGGTSFNDDYYWSSTEDWYFHDIAWCVRFSSGRVITNGSKDNLPSPVRPLLAF